MSASEELMFKKDSAKSFIITVLRDVSKYIKDEEHKKEILFQTERIQKFLKGYPWGTTSRPQGYGWGEVNMSVDVKESIKKHEGYRSKVYLDTLGKRTVGYGHLCVEDFWMDGVEYEKEFLDGIFDVDYKKAEDSATRLFEINGCQDIDDDAKGIIIQMVFQLGPTGVSKFKMMWKCLSELNYVGASYEMLDSRWAKQTPNRAKEMANHMKNIEV